MILAAVVALAGAVGAPARFALDGWLQRRAQTVVPVGTLAINLGGALALGLIAGLLDAGRLPATAETVIGAGFLGAFTTFSTFTFESIRLAEEAAWRALAMYLTATILGGLVAAGTGLWLASII